MNVIFLDEAGQMPAELLSVLYIVLRQVRSNNIPFGGVIFLCTMDHTQLAPIKGKHLIVSSHILSCFKIFRLEHSVRAKMKARIHPSKCIKNPHILNEFKKLASETFAFVNNWNCPEIDPTTYRLYGRTKNRERSNL